MNQVSIADTPWAPRAVLKDKFCPVFSRTQTKKRDSYSVFQRIATLVITPRVFRTPVCPFCQNNSAFNICIVKYVWESFTELSRTPRKFTDVIQSPYYLSKHEQLRGKSKGGLLEGVEGGEIQATEATVDSFQLFAYWIWLNPVYKYIYISSTSSLAGSRASLPRLFRRSVQTFKFACEEGLMSFNEMVH